MAISLKNRRVEQKNHSVLASWSDWALSSQHLLTVKTDLSVHFFLACTVPRHPLVGLLPPSTSFILSLRLTLHAISLLMLVLSHSETHYLNRHMVGCGCHEILIQSCISLRVLGRTSLLYSMRTMILVVELLESFISAYVIIQYSVHHSDPPRNYQSCYREPVISTS